MPLVYNQFQTPSSLIDVIDQVKGALSLMADATPVKVGRAHLAGFGVGSARRILFVPERGPGKVGPPIELGNPASITHSCDVHVRGVDRGDDVQRFRSAYDLAEAAIALVAVAATGRLEWGPFADDSPADVDSGAGVGIKFSFTYRRDVLHSAARWGLDPADADTSGARPVPPPGVPATSVEIDLTVEPIVEEP